MERDAKWWDEPVELTDEILREIVEAAIEGKVPPLTDEKEGEG